MSGSGSGGGVHNCSRCQTEYRVLEADSVVWGVNTAETGMHFAKLRVSIGGFCGNAILERCEWSEWGNDISSRLPGTHSSLPRSRQG
jgi:hypothetical protein